MTKKTKKLEGNNIIICIDNKGCEKELTLGKPYRIIYLKREEMDIIVAIKSNDRVEREYKFSRFRNKIKDKKI